MQETCAMMTKEVQTHSTVLEVGEPLPAEVVVGTDVILKLRVSCAAGCDMRGSPVKVSTPDGEVMTSELVSFDARINETGEIALRAPQRVGEHVWSVLFSPQDNKGVIHEEKSLSICLRTKPHATSLAVWAIPSPVVMGERFNIKVGAKSSAGCELKGKKIEVCDETGGVTASGSFGETLWPGTSALYWTEVELVAPPREGMCSWTVKLEAAELETPHDGASAQFSFAIVKPPDHRLTVKVIDKDTMAPIENAQVRLGPYRSSTDQFGLAVVDLPKGIYDLNVWKVGYEAPATTVEVNENFIVQIEVLTVPEENADAAWLM
jgi:hypothetical protein